MNWIVELLNRIIHYLTLRKEREPYDDLRRLEKELQKTLADQLQALRDNDRRKFDACTVRIIRLREAIRRAEQRSAALAGRQ